jgi:hypothetical protein
MWIDVNMLAMSGGGAARAGCGITEAVQNDNPNRMVA